MAITLGSLGKKIWETLGQGIDRVIPGDQSSLYRPQQQQRQQASPAAQRVIQNVNRSTGFGPQPKPPVGPVITPPAPTIEPVKPVSTVDIVNRLIKPTPIGVAKSIATSNFGKNTITRPLFQGVKRTTNEITGNRSFTPTGPTQQDVFGPKPVGQLQDYTQENFGFKTNILPIDTAIGAVGTTMDLFPAGLPQSAAAREGLKVGLKKATSAIAKKTAQDAAKGGAKVAVKEASAPVKAANVLANEAGSVKVPNVQTPPIEVNPVRVPGQVTNKETLRGQIATRLVDTEAPAINYLKQVEQVTGQKGLVDQFYYDTGLQKRANAIANAKIEASPNIAKAFGGLSKQSNKEFSQYSAAIAELENAKRGMPTSRPVEKLQKTVDELSPTYRARFDAVRNEFRAMTDDLVKGGVIDDATKQAWDANPNYVRIQRVMDDLAGYPGNAGNSYSFGGTNFSKKRTGSAREVQPLDATVFNMRQQVQKEIQRNQTATNLIEALSRVGHARLVKAEDAARKNTIRRVVNGRTEIWEVPKDIKEIADNVSPYQLGLLGNIISAPQRLLRAGATGLSAPFTAANYIKDQLSSAVYSKAASATHTVPGVIEGLWKSAKDFGGGGTDDELWQRFIQTAGDTTSYDFIRNEKNAKMLSGQIRNGTAGRIGNSIAHPIRTLENLNQVTEKATRYQNFRGIYNKVYRETGDAAEAQKQATLAAWQNSVDFSRMGDVGRALNLLIPYFNAGVQGTRLLGRSLKERPAATLGKVTAFAGVPLSALTLYNMSDPDRAQVYDNISDYEKENNLIIILPGAEQNDQGTYEGVIKVPLQPGISDLVQPFRLLSESFASQNPADIGKMATEMMGAFTGPIQTSSLGAAAGSLIPQVAKPLVQQAANKDFFTGKDIVPEYMQQATDAQGNPVPENQKAYKFTSGSSRIIGNAIGQSPIRVDKFIKDTSAKVGQYTQNAVDTGLAAAGIIPQDQIGGVSLKEDFIRRFAQASSKENLNKSEGAKYFDTVKEATSGLNQNELAAWTGLHPNKKNFLGEVITETDAVYDPVARLDAYNRYPRVFEADKKMNDMAKKNGKPGNPLFDLTPEQVKKVLEKDALPPGAKDPELSSLYKQDWYADYSVAKSNYFKTLKEQAAAAGKPWKQKENAYPETSPELQKVMDYYSSLPKGTGARKNWIASHPNEWAAMQNQFAAIDNWQNIQRGKRGLAATEGADGQANGYSSGGSKYAKSGGGGSKGSSKGSNPYQYAVSINAGGKVKSPKISVKKTGGKIAKAKKVAGPKVKTKKSMV